MLSNVNESLKRKKIVCTLMHIGNFAYWLLGYYRYKIEIDCRYCRYNNRRLTIISFYLVLSAMADSEGRIIEEIHLDDDNEVECLEDLMTLDENEIMDASSQDDIVDITPPPEV